MKYHVRVLSRAEREVLGIVDWLAERSTQGMSRWLFAFDDTLRRLESNPEAYPTAAENEFVEGAEIRHLVFKTKRGRPYRVLFTIVGDEVHVLHVRGPGQPPVSGADPDQPPVKICAETT